jgi:hypothetical protein
MKKSGIVAFCYLVLSLIISGCGPTQAPEPTLTPVLTLTPALTSTPISTATSTQQPTLTNTSTPEPTATATTTPVPVCKVEILSSKDFTNWDLIKTSKSDAKHTTVKENDISVAKVVQSDGYFDLIIHKGISQKGMYLISLYVKRANLGYLNFEFFDESHSGKILFLSQVHPAEISNTEYTRVIKTFPITKAPAMLRFGIGAEGNSTVWLKELQICLIE